MKRILITGGDSMLAADFKDVASEIYEIISCSRDDVDISSYEQCKKSILHYSPDIILNCAAYTAVDDAQDTGAKSNFDINTIGATNLAQVCLDQKIDFITISSDYVFDGQETQGYSEYDMPNPINQYGMAKYLAEKICKNIYPDTIIVRTSWLYGGGSTYKNFVNTMLQLSEIKHELQIIDDQYGLPTYARDVSLALCELIGTIEAQRGNIFHFSNTSSTPISWADFATQIFLFARKNITIHTCSSQDYKTKALRPRSSKLINNSPIQLRDWQLGLREYISKL